MSGRKGGSSNREKLKRYHIKRVIEQALLGEVCLATDTRTGEYVVLKRARTSCVRAGRMVNGRRTDENLIEEIRIHQMISKDPNRCQYIINLFDVFPDEKYINLVLEHAPLDLYEYSSDMQEILNQELRRKSHRKGSRNRREALKRHWVEVHRLFKQLLEATKWLHEKRIAHRDLSLENTLMDKDKNARIIDFGMAKDYSTNNDGWLTTRGAIGKTKYCSHECYRDENYDGRDNDMWSLGVMLFMMLVGAPPWQQPDHGDQRFRLIYTRGFNGIKSLVTRWKLIERMPEHAIDFFAMVFRPQKCRMTVHEAWSHPYVTSGGATVAQYDTDDRKVSTTLLESRMTRKKPHYAAKTPDRLIALMVHEQRYKHGKVPVPEKWSELKPSLREKILQCVIRNDARSSSTIMDETFVEALADKFGPDISTNDARLIIHYLWATGYQPSRTEFYDEEKPSDSESDSDCKEDRVIEEGLTIDGPPTDLGLKDLPDTQRGRSDFRDNRERSPRSKHDRRSGNSPSRSMSPAPRRRGLPAPRRKDVRASPSMTADTASRSPSPARRRRDITRGETSVTTRRDDSPSRSRRGSTPSHSRSQRRKISPSPSPSPAPARRRRGTAGSRESRDNSPANTTRDGRDQTFASRDDTFITRDGRNQTMETVGGGRELSIDDAGPPRGYSGQSRISETRGRERSDSPPRRRVDARTQSREYSGDSNYSNTKRQSSVGRRGRSIPEEDRSPSPAPARDYSKITLDGDAEDKDRRGSRRNPPRRAYSEFDDDDRPRRKSHSQKSDRSSEERRSRGDTATTERKRESPRTPSPDLQSLSSKRNSRSESRRGDKLPGRGYVKTDMSSLAPEVKRARSGSDSRYDRYTVKRRSSRHSDDEDEDRRGSRDRRTVRRTYSDAGSTRRKSLDDDLRR